MKENDKKRERQNSTLQRNWPIRLGKSLGVRRKPSRRKNGLRRKGNFKMPNEGTGGAPVFCRFSGTSYI